MENPFNHEKNSLKETQKLKTFQEKNWALRVSKAPKSAIFGILKFRGFSEGLGTKRQIINIKINKIQFRFIYTH